MDIIRPHLKTLFLSHQNADPDAIGSLYFLQNRYDGDVALPNPPDRKGKPLAEYLCMEYILPPLREEYEQYVILDTPNPSQLEPINPPEEKTIIIDHHPVDGWGREIYSEDRTSCAEIVFDMEDPDVLARDEGIGLLAGILTDTSGFRRGDSKTFRTTATIMERSGADIQDVYQVISSKRTYSEKICRLKGAERSSHIRENGFLIAYTFVNSFESSVCEMLLGAGADISFSGSQRGDDFLISSRGRNDLIRYDLDLGRMFHNLADEHENIYGGGHYGAAVLKGEGDVTEYMKLVVDGSRDMIKEKEVSRPLE